MKRIPITLISIFICFSNAFAQSKNTLVQRINEIKSNEDVYFWDQFTDYNAEVAKKGATERLLQYVNNDRAELLSVEDIMPHVSYINIDRGEKKQYFVYIKKTDANAINKGGTITPVVAVQPSDNTTPAIVPVRPAFVPDAFVQRIMETKYFMDVYKLLKSLQAQGQILQFGKLRDVEDYSSLDLILFDIQSQQIITMLSSENGSGNRTNMVNGTDDSLKNYPTNMTAVIWYIKK